MNEHIIDYLKYYINLEHPPQFAILLRGDWGCGKSFFIKRFIESEGKKKFIYTTLYGVSATQEINDQFFEQLHPLLSSTGMKVTSKIIKGFFKGALKIDIGEKGELDVESNLKNGELPSFLTNADSKVIIFDDLERCSMDLAAVMGYINQFVETNGNKVIILANEKEIIASEEKRKKNFITTIKGKYDNKLLEADLEPKNDSIVKYLRIKEKLIGKSFEVSSNMEGALKEFIQELRNHKLIELLTNELELIKTLFKESNYNNLRHLKQSILELERFYLMLPEIVFTKNNLVIDLISYFLCISFELKKGEFKEDDIKVLFVGNSADGGSLFEKLREKYSLDTFPLNINLWFDFFGKGVFSNRQELEDSIRNSNYFYDEKTPAFIKIWRFRDLNDDDFQLLYEKVYNDFKNKNVEDQDLLLHITSMFIFYSEAGLIPISKKTIVSIAKQNVKSLKLKGKLVFIRDDFEIMAYGSLGYHGKDIQEFKDFFNHLRSETKSSVLVNHKKDAKGLLEKIRDSPEEFKLLMTINNSSESNYFDVPILKYISVADFLKTFLELGNREKEYIGYVLKERYRSSDFESPLVEELEWLSRLKESLSKINKKKLMKPSFFIIQGIIDYDLTKSISNLSRPV